MTENTTWPGWRQVRKLGLGSFGTVYEICREDEPSYRAALKVITIPQDESELNNAYGEGMDDNTVSSYFEGMVDDITREITVMDQFKGLTNIVSYEAHKVIPHKNDIGWDILIRMELLTPLLTLERERGYGLTEEETIKLGIDICQALLLCEKSSIIHRDIKPENIFVNRFGDFVLGDFGIARQMEKSMGSMSVKGTYNYMAPEVYNGQHYGKTADIYSLGMVLYRCLNNRRGPFLPPAPKPISYKERQEATRCRMNGEPLPAPVEGSEALKIIVLKATQYKADQRFLSAEELQSALRSVNQGKADHNTELFPGSEEINSTVYTSNNEPERKKNETADFDQETTYRDAAENETVKDGNTESLKVEKNLDLKKDSNSSFAYEEDIEKTVYINTSYGEETNKTSKSLIPEIYTPGKNNYDNSKKQKGMMLGFVSIAAIVVCIIVFISVGTSNDARSESSTLVSEADKTNSQSLTNDTNSSTNNTELIKTKNNLSDIKLIENEKLHVATSATFPPYEMITEDGKIAGIDIEIAAEIAKKLDLELVIDNYGFSEVLDAIPDNKADIVISGLTVFDERKKWMDFTEPYINESLLIIVSENSAITSLSDLNGKTIGCKKDSVGETYCLSDYDGECIRSFDNTTLAAEALIANEVDCIVAEKQLALEVVNENSDLSVLDYYSKEDYAIGVSKGNEALLNEINSILKDMKSDGTLQAIVEKYIY